LGWGISSRELPALVGLPAGEREVTTLVAVGLSNDEIAERLFIGSATAKTHVNRAMTKTVARDRAQLVVFAYGPDWSTGDDPRSSAASGAHPHQQERRGASCAVAMSAQPRS
jgi:DNA-binding CsgD family transcriptional regulator